MIDTFLKDHLLRWLLNRYYGTTFIPADDHDIIYGRHNIRHITLNNGVAVKASHASRYVALQDVVEYDWRDIRPTDIVLDIGANIGAFAIGAAKIAKRVIAMEPLYHLELTHNKFLNLCPNIIVLPTALGDSLTVNISYDLSEPREVPALSFDLLLHLCGEPVSFLKCDCEGAELTIPYELLLPIRRIEMELHDASNPKEQELLAFLQSNWNTTVSQLDATHRMVHAFRKEP
jgi:FkbM family methyltransferase